MDNVKRASVAAHKDFLVVDKGYLFERVEGDMRDKITDKQTKCEPLLSYEELAEITNLKVSFLKKAREEMNLPAFKIGRNVRFRLSEFEVWLKQYQTAG